MCTKSIEIYKKITGSIYIAIRLCRKAIKLDFISSCVFCVADVSVTGGPTVGSFRRQISISI